MKSINFKKLLPHGIAVVVFLLIAVLYCKPAFEGKVLNQHDTQGWKGMAQQSVEVREKTGYFPLWTNSMFGGMPGYQIALDPKTNIGLGLTYFSKVLSLGLPEPASFFFLACICFYILCIVMGLRPWAAILGALAYAYATYDPIIIGVGHNTKMLSMAYAPTVLAGILLVFQKKYWTGFAVTAAFAYVLIAQNHLQIVYYTLIIALAIVVSFAVKAVREKRLLDAVKSSFIILVAGLIGLGACAVFIFPTYDYAKDTMRGGASKLTLNKDSENKTKGGLDKDYALKWSFGKMETFTLMVPGLYGGSNGGNEHSSSALTDVGLPEENAVGMTNGYSYWGNMSSPSETTSGPAYLGAIICFLFIFGLFYINSWHKWWILAASIIGILLSWGSSFQAFNYFMLDYLPFYSKFRAPSMAMVIPQLCFPLLAAMTVSKLMDEESDFSFAWKKFRQALMATGAVLLILAAFYFTADYTGKSDSGLKDNIKQNVLQQVPPGQQPTADMLAQADETSKNVLKAIREDRKSLAGGDLLRSLLLIAFAATLVFLFIRKKVNAVVLAVGLILLTGYDLLGIDKKYLNYDSFREQEELTDHFTPTEADQQILRDPDHANFRVFNQNPNFTNESLTSYHHNSIGGYSPAKLGLYQDLIENQLTKGNMQVFNMLNTKYFISEGRDGKPIAQMNPEAFGNCWLVKGIKYVDGPNQEMLALDNTDLKDTAVIDKVFQSGIKQNPVFDSAAFIKLKERRNDTVTYSFHAATAQFAVLSEIYYNRGWIAYIDGQEAPYARVNYVLRGLYVPAGDHTIEFRFLPKSYYLGRTITIWSTLLIYLVVLGSIILYFVKRKNDDTAPLPKT